MSIMDGKDAGHGMQSLAANDFERLKLVATLATIIFADPSSTINFETAVARARCIIAAAEYSLQRTPNLRLNDEEKK